MIVIRCASGAVCCYTNWATRLGIKFHPSDVCSGFFAGSSHPPVQFGVGVGSQLPDGGARRLDVTSPATPADAVQHGDLVAHLGPHDGARQWEAGIVVGGEGRLCQESAGAGRRAGVGELAQVAAVAGEKDDVDVRCTAPRTGPRMRARRRR